MICERRVAHLEYSEERKCKACHNQIALNYYPRLKTINEMESRGPDNSLKIDVRLGKTPETLYFLCKRLSGSEFVKNDTYFDVLTNSIAQSQRYDHFHLFFYFFFCLSQICNSISFDVTGMLALLVELTALAFQDHGALQENLLVLLQLRHHCI